MDKILCYHILEKIDESRRSIIYRAKKDDDDNTYIIKILKSKFSTPTSTEIARFKQEYETMRKIALDGVVKAYDIVNYENTIAIILEDFGGKSFKNIISKKKLDMRTFLETAIKISGILGELHRLNIIHYNIKPANILINENDAIIKLTDFGISKILAHDHNEIYDPVVVEGTLVYISPEQTGRINMSVDYRSDLYSLGITFYEILTGSVPFRSSDPMDIIHSHIARQPVPPAERNPAIPKIVSDIVMKLLSKNSKDRYQNGFGLKADLENCLEQLQTSGTISEFELVRNDISFTLNLPQKLFGREAEIDMLIEVFKRSARGSREMLLVSGNPGIGKTTLIYEIYMPVIESKGYFISGKYEQLLRDVPYSAIIQAFQILVRQILTEGEERITYWKKNILEAIEPNGRIITSVIPEMELIIGKQPEVPEVGHEESQNRFNLVYKKFVGVFAAQAHPVVLFLDDLQWADSASFKLMKMLITSPDISNFLLIGAYRDTDVDKSHLVALSLDEIKKDGIAINELYLQPLNLAAVNQLLDSVLKSRENDSLSLSRLLLVKTGGNPFFINQFLKSLYEQRLITLDPASGWKWDMQSINEMQVTDNVVDLLTGKIRNLKPETQEALKTAVCAGTCFQIKTISAVSGKSIDQIQSDLSEAVQMGMIYFSESVYCFVHDRILEAAYRLIPDEDREKMHYKIGMYELNSTGENDLMDKIFYIVNQLNAGISLLSSESDNIRLTVLNVMAGDKAMSSTAYNQALKYYTMGIKLLGDDCWEKHYDISLKLYTDAAKAALLNTDFAHMKNYSNIVLSHAANLLDKITIYELRIQSYYAQNKLLDAINESLHVLKLLGCHFPKKPGYINIGWKFIKTKIALLGRQIEEFNTMDEIEDPRILAILSILYQVSHSAYRAFPNLTLLITFEEILLTLKYGIAPQTSFFFNGYGTILISGFGEIDPGYRFGRLALSLKERPRASNVKARTWLVVELMIRHWKNHIREIIPSLHDIYKLGLETGDIEFGTIAAHNYCLLSYFAGKPLKELGQEMAMYSNIIRQFKQETNLYYNEIYRQTVLNLTGETVDPCDLTGEAYNEKVMVPVHIDTKDGSALFDVYLLKTFLNYLFQNYTKAIEYADMTKMHINNVRGLFIVPVLYFYDSLARLAGFPGITWMKQKQYLTRIRANQKKMKKWAQHAPANHLHRYNLVEAELASIKGRHIKAGMLYEKAIKAAHENGFIQDEAIACELTACFYLKMGIENIASVYFLRAQSNYRQWGATAKIKALRESYPQFFNSAGGIEILIHDANDAGSSGTGSEMLDLSSIIQVSQTLASEIELGSLLKKIIKIAIENAGAQKGLFILKNEEDNKLYIEAQYSTDTQIKVLQSIPVEESNSLSTAIINYVNKTNENLVLDHACRRGLFVNDRYISQNGVKSVLCMPVTNKGKMAGILYLENNLAIGAFTAERLKLLFLIASQAAISINNARFLVKEKQNAAFRKEIEMSQKILQSLLPKKLPEIKNSSVAYLYVPVMVIGGDFISILHCPESDKLGLFICDVSGHGFSAAMTAAMISMALDTYWKTHIDEPAKVLDNMRNQLKGKMGGNFFTACLCTLSCSSGMLSIASAGHPPVVIIRKNGHVDMVRAVGRLINEFFDPNLIETKLTLEDGDRLILYTDALIETENPKLEMLGMNDANFCTWLKEMADGTSSPTELCHEIFTGILEYAEKLILNDDLTILALEYTGQPSLAAKTEIKKGNAGPA